MIFEILKVTGNIRNYMKIPFSTRKKLMILIRVAKELFAKFKISLRQRRLLGKIK